MRLARLDGEATARVVDRKALRYDAALLNGDAAAWAHGPRYLTRLIEVMEASDAP